MKIDKTFRVILLAMIIVLLLTVFTSKAQTKTETKGIDILKLLTYEPKQLPPFPKGNPEPKEQPKPVPKPTPPPKPVAKTVSQSSQEAIAYAHQQNAIIFGQSQWNALHELIGRESGWQVGRTNHSSHACGIGQSLPCSKMYGYTPEFHYINGKLFIKNPNMVLEVDWTLQYIKNRYGTPTQALYFHNKMNWY